MVRYCVFIFNPERVWFYLFYRNILQCYVLHYLIPEHFLTIIYTLKISKNKTK